jgi:hypothetical protein
MQSFVSVVNEENYSEWVDKDSAKNKVMIFTDRKSTSPLIKSMSKIYKDKLSFGESKRDKAMQAKFGVTKTPTIMVLTDPYNF